MQRYFDRLKARLLPAKSYKWDGDRPKFVRFEEQPDYIKGGTLKEFQMKGLNWLAYLWSRKENGILADEVRPNQSECRNSLGPDC